jgi:hypothetical protein
VRPGVPLPTDGPATRPFGKTEQCPCQPLTGLGPHICLRRTWSQTRALGRAMAAPDEHAWHPRAEDRGGGGGGGGAGATSTARLAWSLLSNQAGHRAGMENKLALSAPVPCSLRRSCGALSWFSVFRDVISHHATATLQMLELSFSHVAFRTSL